MPWGIACGPGPTKTPSSDRKASADPPRIITDTTRQESAEATGRSNSSLSDSKTSKLLPNPSYAQVCPWAPPPACLGDDESNSTSRKALREVYRREVETRLAAWTSTRHHWWNHAQLELA